ncbi:8-amino-7-oxononanoate synthase [Algivirga pacifica]|uniref:8-amino-7-oxononanoate synthase n=1 Tax=Algivirga pacifica TaxID=1162670 RepID=A0ABP9DES8_9BACT
MNGWTQELERSLQTLEEADMLRSLNTTTVLDGAHIAHEGKKYFNLISNDYLSLASDPNLQEQFYAQQQDCPQAYRTSATASRLLGGNHLPYEALEQSISRRYQKPAALFYNSGYHANLGILPALAEKGDLILSDKLNHASMIDGMRLSAADLIRYRHLDYEHLEKILQQKRHLYKRVFIVTESIFSMDGDIADLATLVRLKQAYDTLLYVDEAHAVGTSGSLGMGEAEQQGVIADIDLLLCPLGKAMASYGAWLVCEQAVKDILVNRSRTLIFSTALPPVNIHWTAYIWERMPSFNDKREQLKNTSQLVREAIAHLGYEMPSQSHIVPIITGEVSHTVALANQLKEEGFWVLPVRPPTVPKGKARLRMSITDSMNIEDFTPLFQLLEKTTTFKKP